MGEEHSLPDVITEHCPGAVSAGLYSAAVSSRQIILLEGFIIKGVDFYVYVKKLNDLRFSEMRFCGPPKTPVILVLPMDKHNTGI